MPYAIPVTRKEMVLRQLRSEIVNGDLVPGTVLKDAEVAARVGLSITPVREAIAQLAAEGLIDVTPNRTRLVNQVTQQNALELIDVMAVLACAGFEWGMVNLTSADLAALRRQYQDLAAALERADLVTAAAVGAAFGSTVIAASGNRELQAHVDMVVTRTLRVLALTPDTTVWAIWREGLRETLELLEDDDGTAALERYRQIYADYRGCVQNLVPA